VTIDRKILIFFTRFSAPDDTIGPSGRGRTGDERERGLRADLGRTPEARSRSGPKRRRVVMRKERRIAVILAASLCMTWGMFHTAAAAERVVELKVPGCV